MSTAKRKSGDRPAFRVREEQHDGRPVGELHYGAGAIVRPGDIVADLPPSSVKWLLDDGVIEPADTAPGKGG